MEVTKVYAFNNFVETGLRIITLLNAAFPKTFDLEKLIYFDYLAVHSGDFSEQIESLHVPTPNRNGEVLVRRKAINDGLDLLNRKGLIQKAYTINNGIEYSASELSSPFIDSLDAEYTIELNKRAEWVIENFLDLTLSELKEKISHLKVNQYTSHE